MKNEEDKRRAAHLYALEARSAEEIGVLLDAPVETVRRWLREVSTEVSSHPMRRGEPSELTTIVQMALSEDQLIDVAVGDVIEGDADVGVGIWDPIASECPHLVERTVEYVRSFANVRTVDWQDTGYIAAYGSGIDSKLLGSELRAWWVRELNAILRRGVADAPDKDV